MLKKLTYVAEYEGRSANKGIEQMLKKRVQEFENEHEKIQLDNIED